MWQWWGELGSLTPLFLLPSGLSDRAPLGFCFPHQSCTSSGVEATGTRSRWPWGGPLFLPLVEVLLAWAAGPQHSSPAQQPG